MQTLQLHEIQPKEALAGAVNSLFNAATLKDQTLIDLAGHHFQTIVGMLDISWKPELLAVADGEPQAAEPE